MKRPPAGVGLLGLLLAVVGIGASPSRIGIGMVASGILLFAWTGIGWIYSRRGVE